MKIQLYKDIIEQVRETKYLGVILDENLSFAVHAYYITKKISKKISWLYSLSSYIGDSTKVLMYKSIIAPHYDYCSSLLINLNQESLSLLQKTQNRAMRVILRVNKYTSIRSMRDALCFMSIEERIKYNVCIFTYKMVNKLTPDYLNPLVQKREHNYDTRSKNELHVTRKRTKTVDNTINRKGFLLYNKLTVQTKTATELVTFKRLLSQAIKAGAI